MRIVRWSLRAGFVGLTSLVCVLRVSAGPALSPDTDRVGADEGTVTYSFFPSTYTPGSPVQVRLTANQYSWGTRVRVEDRFPVGWTASGATPPATQAGNKLVWDLPLAGKKAVTVSYNATAPAGASGIATFHHLVIFSSDSTSQQTDGDRLIAAAGGGCTLTCSAAASTAAGTAPLAVVFVGSAAPSGCSGSVAYDWDFGDGTAHASIASPSHTYTTPGTFTWSMTATIGGVSCTRSGTVNVAAGCSLACTATVPSTAPVGSAVAFQATATPANCTSTTPALQWTFGDGGSASQASTTHTYTQAGDYTWTFRATIAAENAECTRTGSVRVVYPVDTTAPAALYPGVASNAGTNNTQWRTQTYLVNPIGTGQGGELRIVPKDQQDPVAGKTYRASVDPGATQLLSDLYQSVGLPAGSGSGALQMTGALRAWVRTFNLIGPNHPSGLPEGTTFGQDLPAYDPPRSYDTGEEILFPVYIPANQATAPRSNFLIQSLDSATIEVTLKIGGKEKTETLAAGVNTLWSNIGARVGAPVGVTVLSVKATGTWNGYISTIDPFTGDPTTMRGQRPSDLAGQELPGVANQPGLNSTRWKSEIVLYNPQGQPQSVLAELIPRCDYTRPASCVPTPVKSKTYTLTTGETRRIADLYSDLGAGEGAGTLRLGSGVLAWVRTYNQGTQGTFGQDVPGLPEDAAHQPGEQVWYVAHLPADPSEEYRSNLLLQSLDSADQNVSVRVGTTSKTFLVPRHAFVQINNLRGELGVGAGDTAVVVSSTGRWNGTISLIDPYSGDPTTLRGEKTAKPLQITCSASPTSGVPPLNVDFACAITGGTFPYRYAWSFGETPLSTSALPAPRHTYTTSGTFTWQVTVTDATHQQASTQGTVNVYGIEISPATLPAATRGTAYSQAFTQSGGKGAITWSLTGALPAGLAFSASTATLSGTPTQAGSFPTITVKAKDASNAEGMRTYTLQVSCQSITVNPVTLPHATRNTAYSQVFTQTGAIGAVTWSLTGALPTGMSFNAANATLAGTPTQEGSFPITVKAKDAGGCEGTRAFGLTVSGGSGQCGAWEVLTGVPATSRTLTAVASSGTATVVVGHSGTILRSSGVSWTAPTSPSPNHLGDVLWDAPRQQFLVVGFDATVMTSPDGSSWTRRTTGLEGLGAYLWGLATNGSRLVAVGGMGGSPGAATIVTSDDGGVTWDRRTAPSGAYSLRRAAYGGGRFVAVGMRDTVVWSEDGISWNRSGVVRGELWDVAWGSGGFVLVGYDRVIATSSDGNTWVVRSAPVPAAIATFYGVAWNGSELTAVGGYGTILTSPSGVTWTAAASPTGAELTGLGWTGQDWLALGVNGLIVRSTCGSPPPPQEITITLPGNVPMALVKIPAGTFTMGSPTTERGRASDEMQHQVTLTQDYYLGKTEVTQRQWVAMMGTNPSSGCGNHGIGDDYPVYCVSWNDICGGTTGSSCTSTSFIGKVNALLGASTYRMATEAEWERAARGGTQTEFSFPVPAVWDTGCGSLPEATGYMWWCGNNTPSGSKPVGQKQANQYGLKDMHGNVWEWVADWYGSSYPSGSVTDPPGPSSSGSGRVIRGGGWGGDARVCRSANRGYGDPSGRDTYLGFRLARTP